MLDIVPTIQQWTDAKQPFVLARVLATWGSAPRKVGSAMAVTSDGAFVGSVSGGCVEAAVIEQAADVLQSRVPRLIGFGVDDELAWSVGLSCGGQIRVLLEYFPSFSEGPEDQEVGTAWLDMIKKNIPFVAVSWFKDPDPGHCLVLPDGHVIGRPRANRAETIDAALASYRRDESSMLQMEATDAFVHVIRGKARLIVVGATDIATHLVGFASHLGFETVVIDPRPIFADPSRFDPKPDRIISAWPDEAFEELSLTPDTYAVLLSHNPKIDDPPLHKLLQSEVRYIGALGSRKTQEKRRLRLAGAGYSEEDVARIKGPVGLSIGASSPAEIALSIIAEIVAVRNGGL